MTATDITALLPLLFLAGSAVAVLMAIAIRRSHAAALAIAVLGLGGALVSLLPAAALAPRQVTPLLTIDTFGLFFLGLIIAAAAAVAILCYGYLDGREGRKEELYALLLLATLGAAVLTVSSHFASLFLGVELLSVGLYASIGFLAERRRSLEAAIKYLLLTGAATAFLLFGMALIYAEAGSMGFARLAAVTTSLPGIRQGYLLAGTAMIVTGLGFKLAVVPFHFWTPDVYEGAPAPVAAFVATVSKGAVFGLLLRYFNQPGLQPAPAFLPVFYVIAVASMFAGNLLALLQNNVKRILAYSSIAHMGYLLVAFLAGGSLGAAAAAFYLAAYFVTTLSAFGVLTVLSAKARDAEQIEDYRGLFWRHPFLGAVMTAAMLSLAGLPLTAGFLGKFYVVAAGASMAQWSLILILVITSAIGLFYYLRIVAAIYQGDARLAPEPARLLPSLTVPAGVTVGLLALLLLWLGVYPSPLLEVIRSALSGRQ